MTIHSDFFKIAKENCADAFRDTLPARPDTVFIDGQVKLMKSSTVDLWPVFFRMQFYKTIESCYDMGADTVVLGFDDYNHVPVSKTMTQVKRAKQKVDYEFAHSSSLPSKMPEDWGSAMANRTFKVKVILKVLEVTKQWFESMLATNPAYRDRKLVLDYSGVPTLLKLVSPASARNNLDEYIKQHDWTPKQGTVGRGECDIKAFRWMPVSRCLCIVSTDGDYLPLSLLQTSRQQGDSTQKCNIILHRMTTQLPVTSASKRKFLDEGSVKPTKRTYEFVDVESVCKWIRREFPSKVNDPVVQYCALVALCGCDFARNLPRLGPRTLWVLRHRIQNTNLLDVHQAVCALSIGYLHVFVKKNTLPVGMSNTADWYTSTSLEQAVGIYDNVFTRIHNDQRISPRIKIQLWTGKGVTAHVRNALWTMHYWMLLEHCPDPHSDDFGYVRDAKGRTHFATV